MLTHFPLVRVKLHTFFSSLVRPCMLIAKLRRWLRRQQADRLYRVKLTSTWYASPSTGQACPFRFTVAMPVHRVPEGVLQQALASVRGQSYADFEFLLLNDGSPDPHIARVLEQTAREDGRVRLLHRQTPGGLSLGANDLVCNAKGDFVAFVDHDDLLHPQALEAVAAALTRDPDTDWLFTDEDKVNRVGKHCQPCCKLGFSHQLLLAWDYVAHFRVVRRAAILKAGGFRPGFEGAQDWDLALRVVAQGGKFTHVPAVLYHWRVSPGSMAAGSAAKPLANEAAKKALEEHLTKLLPRARVTVKPLFSGASIFRVSWLPHELPPVSVLLPSGQAPPGWSFALEVIPVEDPAAPSAWRAALSRASKPTVVVPAPGMKFEDLQALLGLLLLPGTTAAAGRWVSRLRVTCSGWIGNDRGFWRDPWQGLPLWDPGYCNLAWIPQGRTLLPPKGWVAWTESLLSALHEVEPAPGPWYLAGALAQMPGEKVVTPSVSFPWPFPPAPPTTAPVANPLLRWPSLAEELGIFP